MVDPVTPAELAALMNSPPEAAVKFFEAKGLALTWNWHDQWQDAHSRAFTVAKLARLDVLQDIRDGVGQALAAGDTEAWFQKRMGALLQQKGWWGKKIVVGADGQAEVVQEGSPRRLSTIYRTNLQSAYMSGRWKQFSAEAREAPYVQYIAVMDGRTRPSHARFNGKVFRIDSPAWQVIAPPNGFNCFPAGTPVRADALIGLKTLYAGKMVDLRTRLGHRLTLTANHPVLTARGWIAAHEIEKGDQTLGDSGAVDSTAVGIVNNQQPPTLAEDLFEALAAQGLRVVPMAPYDFHGDASLRKSEIHVAGADRRLMDEIHAQTHEFVRQRHFGLADAGGAVNPDLAHGAPARSAVVDDSGLAQQTADIAETGAGLARDGALGKHAAAIQRKHSPFKMRVAPLGGGPRRTDLTRDGVGVALDGEPFDGLGLGATARLDAAESEQPIEHVTADRGLFGQLLEANPAGVAMDEVVEVRRFDWAGHVYDFQTATGLMIAGGVVVHNCRCRVRNLDAGEMRRRGLKAEKDVRIEYQQHDPLVDARSGKWDGDTAIQRGISIPDARYASGRQTLWADRGWDYNPGEASLKPFTSPPLDNLPRSFAPGVQLPDLPAPTRVPASRLLPDGLPPEDYARAFLAEFGAAPGKPVVFQDVKDGALVIDEALFQDGEGNWKADKDGRGPYMRLLASAIQNPDEIWLRWEPSRDRPGTSLLKRRYLRSFEIDGGAGADPQYGISVFEFGKDGWTGSTAVVANADRGLASRRRYMEKQRDGFLLFRK